MYFLVLSGRRIVAVMNEVFQQASAGGRAPLVIGGVGGSGTRVYRKIVEAAGYTMLTAPWPLQKFSKSEHHDNYFLLKYFYARWVNRYLLDDLSKAELARMRLELQTMLALSGPAHYGRGLWGWKNPRTLYLLPFLNKLYPKMRYIHVIRDGRDHAFHPRFPYEHDVLLSPEQRRLEEHVRKALAWRSANALGQQAGDTFLQGRYMQSRLEDLCANPVQEIRRIFNFLGCHNASGIQEAAQQVRKPSSFGRWRKQPAEAIAAVEQAAGDQLERYSYMLHTDALYKAGADAARSGDTLTSHQAGQALLLRRQKSTARQQRVRLYHTPPSKPPTLNLQSAHSEPVSKPSLKSTPVSDKSS